MRAIQDFNLGLTDGVKKTLKNGDQIVSKGGTLFIKVKGTDNSFRGIDTKFDVEAMEFIKGLNV